MEKNISIFQASATWNLDNVHSNKNYIITQQVSKAFFIPGIACEQLLYARKTHVLEPRDG